MTAKVLVVDDDPSACEAIADDLRASGHDVLFRTSADEAFALVGEHDFDVVITDLQMRGMNGLELCGRIVANRPDLPVIVVTAFGSLDTAIATIRAGAFDFMEKPFAPHALPLAVERAAQGRALREEVKRLRRAAESVDAGGLVGKSAAIESVRELIARIAPSDITVLVTGESGTGKDLVARAIHAASPRHNGPFVAINCAAVPENLLESELFGHARGAFTDARTARRGLFLDADGGTLFLDEIGDMPLAMQAKLLRALEERVVRAVGGTEERAFDTRVVAATNLDLATAIEERRFREDLYYRINVMTIELPPLRSRAGDILLLAQHFVEKIGARTGSAVNGLSPAAAESLLAYAWPGNVRELRNCMERAVALARFEHVVVEDLPDRVRSYRPQNVVVASDDPSELVSLDEVAQRYVVRVFEAVGGNKSAAARTLGLDRKTLYRRLARAGLLSVDEGEHGSESERRSRPR